MLEDDLGTAMDRPERCAELSTALGLPAIDARALQLLGVSRLELGDLHGARAASKKRNRSPTTSDSAVADDRISATGSAILQN